MKKRQMTQHYINEFKAWREEWKAAEKRKMEEENRAIKALASLQKERESQQDAKKAERQQAMGHVQKQLAEEIARRDAEAEEMERVRLDLYLEEQEEKERRKEMKETERRIRQRLELQSTHAQQMHYKALRVAAQRDEEEAFRQQMLAKLAQDDRIEQMNAQKRRMKQAEHKRQVEALLDERRAQLAAERQRQADERAEEARLEDLRKQIIEDERRRLLKEHATRLLGFLPKGVIQGQGDLQMLGQDFQDAYARRQVDPYDESAWDQGK